MENKKRQPTLASSSEKVIWKAVSKGQSQLGYNLGSVYWHATDRLTLERKLVIRGYPIHIHTLCVVIVGHGII
jgi:hypothetical protein